MTPCKTILYVEDDAVVRTAYQRRLQGVGFTVEPAKDGVEALKYLENHGADLILLDLMLPRLDGEGVLKYIDKTPHLKHIPIIILSTNSTITLANEHLLEMAAKRLLKHTCTFERLFHSIEAVVADADVINNRLQRIVDSGKPRAEQLNGSNITPMADLEPDYQYASREMQELQKQMQIVCAWTGRIKVKGEWMTVAEFLSKRLHLAVTHGISPDALKEIVKKIPADPGPLSAAS
jgi:CheY-like chemotaxis protein